MWYFIFHNIFKKQVPSRQTPGAATDKYKFKIVFSQKEVDQTEFFKIRYSMCESRSWPTRIASKDTSNSFLFFRAQARRLTDREHTERKKGKASGAKRINSANIGVERWEVKCLELHVTGHAPRVRTSRPRVTLGLPREWRSVSAYRGTKPKSRPHSTAPSLAPHIFFIIY